MTEQKARPGQRHIEVRISSSARIYRLLAPIPFTEEKHGGTRSINNQQGILAARWSCQFLEATQSHETALPSSFRTHRHHLPSHTLMRSGMIAYRSDPVQTLAHNGATRMYGFFSRCRLLSFKG